MAQKTVNLPNGQTVTVNVPDGATDRQILRFVKREYEAGRIGQPKELPPPDQSTQIIESESAQINQQQQPESPRSFGQKFAEDRLGTMEAVGSMLTGSLGEIAGGWAGLLTAPFVGADEAANNVRAVSDFLTYKPKTESGKAQQKAVAEVLSPVAEWLSDKPAEAAFELAKTPQFRAAALATNSPLLTQMAADPALAASMGASAPTAILELLGLKGLSKAKTAKQARTFLADEIVSGNRDVSNILQAVDQNGRLTKNIQAKDIIRLYDNELAGKRAAITFDSLDNADKAATRQMLNMIEKGRNTGRQYVMENRPADVIGRGVANRIKEVKKLRKKASEQMSAALPRLRDKTIDINPEGISLIDSFESLGVKVNRNNKGRYKLDFSDSTVSLGDGMKKSDLERLLNLVDSPSKNGAQVHGIKKFAQEISNYDKTLVKRTASKEIEDAVKGLASSFNQKLRVLDSSYAKANDIYSSSADSMKAAQKFLKNVDIESPIADKRLGNISKRIASNFTSRDEVMMMLDDLDNVLSANNISVSGDLRRQVAVLAEIEDAFRLEGQQSPFGLSGRVETAIQAAADPAGTGLLRGVEGGIRGLRKWRTPDFDERMRILRQSVKESQK